MTTQTFALDGPINLRAWLGRGTLTVTAIDEATEASVTLTDRDPAGDAVSRITVAMRGRTLEVLAPREGGLADVLGDLMLRNEPGTVDAEIVVPAGTAMQLSTFTADITLVGRSAGADVATAAGAIVLDHVDGDLRLRFGRSQGRVERVSGDVVVRSGSGDVSLGQIDGNLEVATGSGEVTADVVRGSVRARAGSGGLRLAAAHGSVDFTCGSGPLSVGLPAGVAVQLDVKTGSGQVRSDLPIEDQRTGSGPSIAIRARTGSGDVYLFRAA